MANTTVQYLIPTGLRANTFTRAGHLFEGWTAKRASDNKYLYKSGSTENWYQQNQQPSGYALKVFADQATVSTLSPVNADTITMYAQWSLIPVYTIVFDANGGSGTMANTTAQYNVYSLLPANTFTLAGYLMAGWTAHRASDNKYLYRNSSTGAEGWYLQDQQPSNYTLKVFADQTAASPFSPVDGDTITLTAQWIDANISYQIVYDANGGYGTMPNTTAAFLNEVSLLSNKFKNAGYLMAGWTAHRASDDTYLYEDVLSETEGWYPEGQEPSGYDLKILADQATVSALSEVTGDTITMRAQWEDDEGFVPIDPRDLEEPLLRYNLKRSGLTLDEQGLDDLTDAILGLDILSLDMLRDIYEGEGNGPTETEDLIAALLADYSTEELFMFVYPLLAGEDMNQWLEPESDLWPWIWFLEGLISEITGCLVDVLDLDLGDENDEAMAL
ncbi:MAG: InlB B-repeat-containing protein, partial [Oscillospiraceae bacterium]|nr:InlB B-repeat-containing protein [Oscillospiraceae bacterium]